MEELARLFRGKRPSFSKDPKKEKLAIRLGVKPKSQDELLRLLSEGEAVDHPLGTPAFEEDFLGREQEIKAISDFLNNGTSVYIYGDRRSGKTSILRRIEFLTKGKPSWKTLFLDFQFIIGGARQRDEQESRMARSIRREVREKKITPEVEKLVVLIDEAVASLIAKVPDLPEQIVAITGIQSNKLLFVVAGFKPLQEIRSQQDRGIFWLPEKQIEIEPFIPPEIRERAGIPW